MTVRLGVDVDLTVFDTGREWFNYCRSVSSMDVPDYDEYLATHSVMPYAMANIFKDLDNQKCLDFWRNEFVYDQVKPIKDSVEVLEDLKLSKGFEIIFVSTIKGNHHKSKYYALKKNFPFMDGFIATKEKKYAKVDILIDDRLNVLEQLDRGTIAIQFVTPFTQTSDFKPAYSFDVWSEFSKLAYRNF